MTREHVSPAIRSLVLLALLGTGTSCTNRPAFKIGDDCLYAEDCADLLVCNYGRCRKQCEADVDCGIGLMCYFEDGAGPVDGGASATGGCQLADESECDLPSECPEGLVCRFHTCTFECLLDVDCGPDSACVEEPSGFACVPTNDACIYNSDCVDPQVCGSAQICQLECREDRDCVPPRTCDPVSYRCVL